MTIESTLKERGERYGDFADHAKIAQALQDVARGAEGWVRLDAAQRQALTVICDKIARILSGDPTYADNWHDIQGYAKLVEDRLPVRLEVTDVHGEMRKSWRKGQLWQRMGPMSLGWSDVDGEPAWSPWDMYRRSPECKWVEPKESAADVTPKSQLDLPVVELPASMRCGDAINVPQLEAEKPWYPDEGDWIEVSEKCHSLPHGLYLYDSVVVLTRRARLLKAVTPAAVMPERAQRFLWDEDLSSSGRIVAYKVVK